MPKERCKILVNDICNTAEVEKEVREEWEILCDPAPRDGIQKTVF